MEERRKDWLTTGWTDELGFSPQTRDTAVVNWPDKNRLFQPGITNTNTGIITMVWAGGHTHTTLLSDPGVGSHMLFYSITDITDSQLGRQAGRMQLDKGLEYKMLLHHFVNFKLNKNSILIAQPGPRAPDRKSPFLTL